MSPEKKKLLNIFILGFSFMFLFTAFQTCGNVAQTVISNLNNTDFHGSGYTSLAIIYSVFSASNLIAPSVVAIIGSQFSMFLSGLFYSAYIAMFIQPFTWSFYTLSVFIGIAAAVLWTAQGACLTVNSDEDTIGRNSGIFWALLQFSMLFGNLYIYVAWKGEVNISERDRRTVFIALTVISLVGTVLFFLIRTPNASGSESLEDDGGSDSSLSGEGNMSSQSNMSKAVNAFTRSMKLCVTKEMLLLSISMAYTGLELTFYSGVYGTCIGSINWFGAEAKSLIGLSGIFVGLGEILGGGVFGLLSKNSRFGRNPVFLLGLVVHFLAFYLIFLNVPNDAPIASRDGTFSRAFVDPSKFLALFSSFLLGLGDSCFNTQLLSILGSLYAEDSAPAFAIFKFVQSISTAVAFFYSNYLLLQWQLLIMVIFGFFGTIAFFFVELGAVHQGPQDTRYGSI
ncbi:UNC93-like protein MFSD11 isoform X2 [Spea bombifrons]|uniref:UNC93-like protein MFSD11 isoform X2 n=1 Tax=Spea bombifrons TaxID=233779 RepID=UPI00234B9A34|nr:UNC93-like protein MFSD11 isoform X2 [Spea bombifrons]